MIILFSKNVNDFCRKSFENCEDYNSKKIYIQDLFLSITDQYSLICPMCHTKHKMIKYGFYSRHVEVLCNNKIEDFYIKVQRFQCKSCKSTHAYLPSFIIPYIILSSFSIIEIIQEVSRTSVLSFVEKVEHISAPTVYSYLKLAKEFFIDFRKMNCELDIFPYNDLKV